MLVISKLPLNLACHDIYAFRNNVHFPNFIGTATIANQEDETGLTSVKTKVAFFEGRCHNIVL